MSRWWLGALLALAACGKPTDHAPDAPAMATALPAPGSAPSGEQAASEADVLLGGLVTPRQQGAYAPRDDCARLPGATQFRRALADAVVARNAQAIADLAMPDVKLGFGGEDGRERFRAELAKPDSKLMKELAALLRLGCAADVHGMTMPWYFAQDLGDVDSFAAMLSVGSDVPLYASADPASAVKQRLSWELVTLDNGLAPGKPLQQVTTVGGAKGYAPTDKLRSMLAYRLLAVRQDGTWKISAIVAGD